MRQLLLPAGLKPGSLYIAKGRDFHYLSRVLRLKKGARLQARDPLGKAFSLILVRAEHTCLTFRVEALLGEESSQKDLELVLYCCLPKPIKMDLIVRMTTEIGVKRIVPVVSDYSVIKAKDLAGLRLRQKRWEAIARAAIEQSGRTEMLVLDEPVLLKDLPLAGPPDEELAVFAYERPSDCATLHSLLAGNLSQRIKALVGPEGGLSQAEVARLRELGFKAVSLGPNILRSETAAVFICAAITTLVMERGTWKVK